MFAFSGSPSELRSELCYRSNLRRSLLGTRCDRDFWFRKVVFIELGIHHDLFDDDFLYRNKRVLEPVRRSGHLENFGLQNMRNLEAAYRPIVAIVHLHWMIYAIEPPGLPFNFRFQKGLRINPVMDRLAVFHGQLELIGVAVLNFLHAY